MRYVENSNSVACDMVLKNPLSITGTTLELGDVGCKTDKAMNAALTATQHGNKVRRAALWVENSTIDFQDGRLLNFSMKEMMCCVVVATPLSEFGVSTAVSGVQRLI